MHISFTHLADEQGLGLLRNALLVGCLKVLGKSRRAAVGFKHVLDRVRVEVNIINVVGAFVSPVRDDGLALELCTNLLLEHWGTLGVLLYLNDAVKACLSWHELENRVHHKGAADLALESRGFEPLPNHEALACIFNGVGNIKEARCFANLLEGSVTESCLNNDVEQILSHWIIRVVKLLTQADLALCVLANKHSVLLRLVNHTKADIFIKFSHSVNLLTRTDVQTECHIHFPAAGLHDLVDQTGVPNLHTMNIKHVLVHHSALTKLELVLIADHLDVAAPTWDKSLWSLLGGRSLTEIWLTRSLLRFSRVVFVRTMARVSSFEGFLRVTPKVLFLLVLTAVVSVIVAASLGLTLEGSLRAGLVWVALVVLSLILIASSGAVLALILAVFIAVVALLLLAAISWLIFSVARIFFSNIAARLLGGGPGPVLLVALAILVVRCVVALALGFKFALVVVVAHFSWSCEVY
jgi:hypothetical protein